MLDRRSHADGSCDDTSTKLPLTGEALQGTPALNAGVDEASAVHQGQRRSDLEGPDTPLKMTSIDFRKAELLAASSRRPRRRRASLDLSRGQNHSMAYEAQLPCSGSGRHTGHKSKPLPQNGCSIYSQSLTWMTTGKYCRAQTMLHLGTHASFSTVIRPGKHGTTCPVVACSRTCGAFCSSSLMFLYILYSFSMGRMSSADRDMQQNADPSMSSRHSSSLVKANLSMVL